MRPSPPRRGPSSRRPEPRRPEGPRRGGDGRTNRNFLRKNLFKIPELNRNVLDIAVILLKTVMEGLELCNARQKCYAWRCPDSVRNPFGGPLGFRLDQFRTKIFGAKNFKFHKFSFVRPSPPRRGPSSRRPEPRCPEGPRRGGDARPN